MAADAQAEADAGDRLLASRSPDESAAFVDAFSLSLGTADIKQARRDFEDAFRGEWSSFKDYAEDYVNSTGMLSEVPESIRNYFDYDAFARDLAYDYTVVECSGGVYVFDSNW